MYDIKHFKFPTQLHIPCLSYLWDMLLLVWIKFWIKDRWGGVLWRPKATPPYALAETSNALYFYIWIT